MSQAICIVRWQTGGPLLPLSLPSSPPHPLPLPDKATRASWASHLSPGGPGRHGAQAQATLTKERALGAVPDPVGMPTPCQASPHPRAPQAARRQRLLPAPALPGPAAPELFGAWGWGAEPPRLQLHPRPATPSRSRASPSASPTPWCRSEHSPVAGPDHLARLPTSGPKPQGAPAPQPGPWAPLSGPRAPARRPPSLA